MKIKQLNKLLPSAMISIFTATATLPVVVHAEKIDFKVSGQISRAVTYADNGVDSDVLFVDNNSSGTRLRVKGKTDLGNGVTAGIYWETQYQDNSSGSIDIDTPDNASTFTSRHRDLWFKGGWGKVSLGQGNGAANSTSEVDYSGTNYIADYSGNNLDDGISFVDGATVVKNSKAFSNFDGLSRNDRIRYDLPNFGPLAIALSAGDERTEIALRYSKQLDGGGKVGAALGQVSQGHATDTSKEFDQLGLSASLLLANGLNFSIHFGERDNDSTSTSADSDGTYIKIGKKSGNNSSSLSLHTVNDLAADGDEAQRINVAHIYNIPKVGIELFGFIQTSSLDRAGANFDDVTQVSVGSRFKF